MGVSPPTRPDMRAQILAIIQRIMAWLTIGRVGMIQLLIVAPG